MPSAPDASPTPDPANDVTVLLQRLSDGDTAAATELLPLVYDELHHIARHYMGDERSSHTLQTTALVHEAWLRLSDPQSNGDLESRRQFFFVAARAMRQALVDHARTRGAAKRGGDRTRQPLEGMDELLATYESRAVDLLALDEALERLAEMDATLARIVELRFFAGMDHRQTSEILGTSRRSVERGWAAARAWLATALDPS